VVTCAVEHPAVLCYLRVLKDNKMITLTNLPVDGEGFVDAARVEAALTITTALVTIMHSNNEVGTVQPIRDISHRIRQYNASKGGRVLLHTDAAQSVGKIPVDADALAVDFLTLVAHKMGAPKGIAALYIHPRLMYAIFLPISISLLFYNVLLRVYHRAQSRSRPLLVGGGQEGSLRGGTESTLLIAALGAAAEVAIAEQRSLPLKMLRHKLRLVTGLTRIFPGKLLRFNGPKKSANGSDLKKEVDELTLILDSSDPLPARRLFNQLPNTVSVSFLGLDAQELINALSDKVLIIFNYISFFNTNMWLLLLYL
jgi:cysteine desulfurase